MSAPELKQCPEEGVHRWLWHAACKLVEAGMSDAEATAFILERMTRAPSPSNEIESALASARREERPETRRWPKRSIKLIAKIRSNPLPNWTTPALNAEQAIDLLFSGDDTLLCMAKSQKDAVTKRRGLWRGQEQHCAFVVSSPMTALRGRTQAGHMGNRTLDNTGPRKYMVTEQDWGDEETQRKLIAHLATLAPLVCVVHSGSRSLHAWFDVEGEPEERIAGFFGIAVSLGVDKAVFGRERLVRMPGGWRADKDAHQKILYFDR